MQITSSQTVRYVIATRAARALMATAVAAASLFSSRAALAGPFDGVGQSASPDAQRALDMNQIFHGTFSSEVKDGKYVGKLDLSHPLYAPTRHESGALFTVPRKDDFDSVRINVDIKKGSVHLGTILGGVIYWRDDTCVIAFGAMRKPDGEFTGVRGYFPVAALESAIRPAITGEIRPGMTLFVPAGWQGTLPIVVDHKLNPPSDEVDDD